MAISKSESRTSSRNSATTVSVQPSSSTYSRSQMSQVEKAIKSTPARVPPANYDKVNNNFKFFPHTQRNSR